MRFPEFLRVGAVLPPRAETLRLRSAAGTLIVDCLWPDARLVVELDSRRHHADWEAAERDRARMRRCSPIGPSDDCA